MQWVSGGLEVGLPSWVPLAERDVPELTNGGMWAGARAWLCTRVLRHVLLGVFLAGVWVDGAWASVLWYQHFCAVVRDLQNDNFLEIRG
jgi:hypothetical protein